MREIKFRVYIKSKNIMTEVKSLHLGTRKVIIGYSESETNYGNYSVSFDDIELMQYTGLKDKNGKEVYEGDITNKGIVKYGLYKVHCCGCCYAYHTCVGFYLDTGNEQTEADEETFENIEVLGDVYSNPEHEYGIILKEV